MRSDSFVSPYPYVALKLKLTFFHFGAKCKTNLLLREKGFENLFLVK
jgi:hypothetical protein